MPPLFKLLVALCALGLLALTGLAFFIIASLLLLLERTYGVLS